MYSDNAKTFLSCAKILTDFLLSDEFESQFRSSNISFRNIPIYAPWYGATWERLIKIVKDALYKTIGRNVVSHANFLTVITDIQLTINNRPLTYRTKEGSLEVITPYHLLSLGSFFPGLVISEKQCPAMWDMDDVEVHESLVCCLKKREELQANFE